MNESYLRVPYSLKKLVLDNWFALTDSSGKTTFVKITAPVAGHLKYILPIIILSTVPGDRGMQTKTELKKK